MIVKCETSGHMATKKLDVLYCHMKDNLSGEEETEREGTDLFRKYTNFKSTHKKSKKPQGNTSATQHMDHGQLWQKMSSSPKKGVTGPNRADGVVALCPHIFFARLRGR